MKKLLSILFASLFAFSVSFAPAAFADPVKGKTMLAKTVKKAAPVQTKANEKDMPGQVVADAMWVAGGQDYQVAVIILAKKYNEKMDKNCRVKNFDVGLAAQNYRFVPFVNVAVRDKMILKQVATMGCEMSPYIQKDAKVAAIQKFWKM